MGGVGLEDTMLGTTCFKKCATEAKYHGCFVEGISSFYGEFIRDLCLLSQSTK